VIETLGKIAGIAGITVGVFFLLVREIIRKHIFPSLNSKQTYNIIRLTLIFTWSVAVIGMILWIVPGRVTTGLPDQRAVLLDRPDVNEREQWKRIWKQVGAGLAARVASAQAVEGGFYSYSDTARRGDSWTTAQCLAALIAGWDSLVDPHHIEISRLQKGFEWLSKNKIGEGWSAETGDLAPNTEVTAWVGLAYMMALENTDLFRSPKEKEDALNQLRGIYHTITERQTRSGGWTSYVAAEEKDAVIGAYATFASMYFLLMLRDGKASVIAESDIVLRQIDDGVRWILSSYNFSASAWEDVRGIGPTSDLSILYLILLTKAKSTTDQIGSAIAIDRAYREAKRSWLLRSQQESSDRPVMTNSGIKQGQIVLNGAHELVDREFPATILWYPWSVLLVTYMIKDDNLDFELAGVLDIQRKLWARLPDATTSLASPPTFRSAETLLVLGLIGRANNWN
jgi:hypothetical protein